VIDGPRHSEAQEVELISDPDELARQEALNGLCQFDKVVEIVEYYLQPGYAFRLRPSQILTLHRTALEGISKYAGNWRPANIAIGGSAHQPIGAHQVPEMVEELCDYVNQHWNDKTPLHLSAYVMWRLNWIHPFTDGNGRTSRATSYLVLCMRLGYLLPGKRSIPDQIAEDRTPYYKALEAADSAWNGGHVDLTAMENLLATMLAKQLHAVYEDSIGSA
jgi:Fic family protein